MAENLETLKTRAYVVPFAVFMCFLVLGQFIDGAIRWEHPEAPWWRHAPEQWLYPLQAITCFVLVWVWRRWIKWDWNLKESCFGIVFGVLGILCWLLPTMVADRLPADLHTYFGEPAWPWYEYLLGLDVRSEGFDPSIVFNEGSGVWWGALLLRFFRAVVVVALVEELFWRGYLMRLMINRDYPWKVPFGTHSWLAYGVTTLCFILIHNPVDYLGAFVYGSLAYLLTVWRKNLGSVVVMHAVANLLLGLAAVCWGKYGLW